VGDGGQEEDRVDDADFKWLEPGDFVDLYRQSPYHQQVLDEIRSHFDDPKHDSVDTTYGDDDGQLPLADKAKPAKYPTPLYKYDCLLSLQPRECRVSCVVFARLTTSLTPLADNTDFW
jgi:hypothetical protein